VNKSERPSETEADVETEQAHYEGAQSEFINGKYVVSCRPFLQPCTPPTMPFPQCSAKNAPTPCLYSCPTPPLDLVPLSPSQDLIDCPKTRAGAKQPNRTNKPAHTRNIASSRLDLPSSRRCPGAGPAPSSGTSRGLTDGAGRPRC
jgi:hypothetical protein